MGREGVLRGGGTAFADLPVGKADRGDDEAAEEESFDRSGRGLGHRPEIRFAENCSDPVEAQARTGKRLGEKVEAAAHEVAAEQRDGGPGDSAR